MVNKETYLICGCNHTGTTMVVPIMTELGISAGDQLTDYNENIPFVKQAVQQTDQWAIELDSRFKDNTGHGWKSLTYPPLKKIEELAPGIPYEEHNDPWCVKVPAITILLPAYLKIYPQAKIIYCTRTRTELRESLLKRDGVDEEHWDKFIDLYRRRFRLACKRYNFPYMTLTYERWYQDPQRQFKELCYFTNKEYNEQIYQWLLTHIK